MVAPKIPALCDISNDATRAARRKMLMLEDDILRVGKIIYRKDNRFKTYVFYLFSVCTVFTLAIVFAWPSFRRRRYMMLSDEATAEDADFAIVDNEDGSYFEPCRIEEIRPVPLESLSVSAARKASVKAKSLPDERKMFIFRHSRFIYRNREVGFSSLSQDEAFLVDGQEATRGSSEESHESQYNTFGQNLIDVPVPPIPVLLIKECVHPFIVFQIWAVLVWCFEDYALYSACIGAIAIGSAVINLWEVLDALKDVRRLAWYEADVTILIKNADGSSAKKVISSTQLAPGDIVVLNDPCKVPADCVLIQGGASVTEAMLTGEVTVVSKSNIVIEPKMSKDEVGDLVKRHGNLRNTLFMGTILVAPRTVNNQDVLAIVVRTGYETTKGRLILSILYPKAPSFKFFSQSLKFLGMLAILAAIGFAVNIYALRSQGNDWLDVLERGLDMITIVVPPALPMALTVGVLFALGKLKKKHGVSCISPDAINVAGKINTVIFDKTGTLTEDSLDMSCVVCTEVQNQKLGRPAAFASETNVSEVVTAPMKALLAVCQSLVFVSGEVAGDPLEVKTFKFSGAEMTEAVVDNEINMDIDINLNKKAVTPSRITIQRYFEFSPRLGRMGTLCSLAKSDANAYFNCDSEIIAFHKGAPEIIVSLCNPESVPADIDAVLNRYTSRGLRVIAAAYRPYSHGSALPPSSDADAIDALRAATEKDLTFLGLVVLENKLKPATIPTLFRLQNEAAIRVAMATGDNAVTAVAVSRECGIVKPNLNVYLGDIDASDDKIHWRNVDDVTSELDPETLTPVDSHKNGYKYCLALTGKALNKMVLEAMAEIGKVTSGEAMIDNLPVTGGKKVDQLYHIISNCRVYARMTPEHKALVVKLSIHSGLYVMMVGDGANDTMGLKVAHVGLSLSLVEASVAASFTSRTPDISNVIPILLEGRGALAMAFSMFQWMALYSTIQFCNALCILFKESFLSNTQFIWQDLIIIFILAIALGYTSSTTKLSVKRPSGRLSSGTNIFIVFTFIGLTIAAQLFGFALVQYQDFYIDGSVPLVSPDSYDTDGSNAWIPETATVFLIGSFQYVGSALIFPLLAMPWKKIIFTNYLFSGWLLIIFVATCLMCLDTDHMYWAYMQLTIWPWTPGYWLNNCFYIGMCSILSYFLIIGGFVYLKRTQGHLFRACKKNKIIPRHKITAAQWAETMKTFIDRPAGYLDILIDRSEDTAATFNRGTGVYKGMVENDNDSALHVAVNLNRMLEAQDETSSRAGDDDKTDIAGPALASNKKATKKQPTASATIEINTTPIIGENDIDNRSELAHDVASSLQRKH